MQADAVPGPGCGLHTLHSQEAAVTVRPLEDEGPVRNPLSVSVAVVPLAVEAGLAIPVGHGLAHPAPCVALTFVHQVQGPLPGAPFS